MIDAAGAIYVIGGTNSTGFYNDVWASTDGGARAGLGRGGGRRVLQGGTTGVIQGYEVGTQGYEVGTTGYCGVLMG